MRGEPPEWAVLWVAFAVGAAVGWALLRPLVVWAVLELFVALS